MRLIGLMAIIPVTVFLTTSYFVLLFNDKTDKKYLKNFSMVVCVLLWICAGLIAIGGIFTVATGKHPLILALKGYFPETYERMTDKAMPGKMQGDEKRIKDKEAGEVKK